MDSSSVKSKPNPRERANLLSVLFWWWTIDLFKTGYRKILQTDDLYNPLKTDRSHILGDRLEKRWNIEVENAKRHKRQASLLRAIFRTFLWEYTVLGLMQILNEFVIRLGTPMLLGGLLRYFKKGTTETYEAALLYAGGICIATAVNVITLNQAIFGAFHVGARIRVATCSVVYRKALRLSKTALGETAPGKVVNLVANDVNRFDLVSIFIHHMWSAPLSAMIIAYFLYTEAGYSGLIGIAAVFVVVPIQSYTGKLSSIFRLQTAIKTDERVRLMDEIISGVQVIKMYAWEKPFCALIETARKLELRVVIKSAYIRGIYMTFNLFTTRMALFCTLISMLLFKNELTADKVFVFSSYFNILAHTMSGMFVRGFAEIAECLVAVRRLQHFLMYEEFQENRFSFNKLAASLNGSINSVTARQASNKASKPDIPYIDDEVDGYENLDDSSEKRRHNGLVVVASDLLKNTANLVGGEMKRSSMASDEPYAVRMSNLTAKWEPSQSENTLEVPNLDLMKGKMYAVIGMVGAGKSSFLSAILGEIDVTGGYVKVNGAVSYAGQESWVFGSTVRQNILFGQPYDRHRYQKVVKACSLLRDFKQFTQGDQTVVGERGSSLSGGQKARINLARSLYRQADIYLLDDPLSAVDTHVSKHLFEECMQRYLAGKTRILVTHQLQYVKNVDAIIVIDQGKITLFSHYQDLLSQRPEYAKLLATESEMNEDSSLEKSTMRRQFSSSSTRSRTPEASSGGTDDEEEDEDPEKFNDGLEGTSRGVVKGPIFLKYFKTGANPCLTITLLLLFICTQFMASFNDYFVPILVSEEETRYFQLAQAELNATNNTSVDDLGISSVYDYMYVYTAIIVGLFCIAITRSLTFYKVCTFCSQKLHDMAFSALIRTGMTFFDTNPSGRILNRFSKDMGAIDELLPKAILDAGQICMMMFGSLAVSCIINPLFLIPIVFLGTVFYWIRKVFLKTSKNIKRMEGMTRSPVFTHLNATLNGLATIRAYRAQEVLRKEFDKLQDVHMSTVYMYVVASTAFGFSLDIFCFVFTSLVTFSFLLLQQSFSGGQVGLAITQVMAMTGMIQWGMRQNAEVANQMMAVERVLEYTQIAPEPNLRDRGQFAKKTEKQDALPANAPKNWPNEGTIRFRNVYMRYTDDDPPVLKGLNIVIRSGEKIGIVGRTGAGKSSLISALFRLAKVEGVIEIDGIDTASICLEDLRRNISIIPQDPVLFSGTLRRNLDPFNEFSDKSLWEVLDEVELKDAVVTAGTGLESRVLDRGSNYSVGQRQLVCLARAILRNNRILMLDEATANVDPQTDALIQHTIRKKFARCTVLTVAHRLNTIMDSDKVLVMDKGRMAEFDHPHILLQNSHSHFTSLVRETDRAMYDQLVRVARQSYIAKHGER